MTGPMKGERGYEPGDHGSREGWGVDFAEPEDDEARPLLGCLLILLSAALVVGGAIAIVLLLGGLP